MPIEKSKVKAYRTDWSYIADGNYLIPDKKELRKIIRLAAKTLSLTNKEVEAHNAKTLKQWHDRA